MELLICDGLRYCFLFIIFFSSQQHGLRNVHSRITNPPIAVDRSTKFLDRKGKFDFSNDFGDVNHFCLSNKLKQLGIKTPSNDWLTSYLKIDIFKSGLASLTFRP